MEQPQTTALFQTNQTATSSVFGIPQKQSTTNSAKQDCKLDSKEAMEVVTQDLAKTDKGAVSPIRQTLGTKQGNSGNSLCSGYEAEIEHRTLALKREGFWSLKRLSRITEPVRPKVHWDYLCEEMQWLSADFAQERRWKRGVARKVVRMVMRHHEELRQKEERAKREEQAKLRRVASSIAKEVRSFWSSVEKVVQYKQQSRLEEKRKKALDLQLDFIVGQTERYSDMLSQSLQAAPVHSSDTAAVSKQSQLNTVDEDDRDFEPPCEEDDDEETIEVEEQQEGNDAETQRREIELLREEGTLPLDQLLSTLTLPQDVESEEEASDTTSSTVEEEDKEFSANEEDAEDEEDTIAAQEVIEGDGDHAEELDDLAREGKLNTEILFRHSKGTEEEEDEDVQESDDEDDNDGGEGMEVLLREGDHSPAVPTSPRPKKEISHIAATAESLQPKGYTLATTKVKTPIPFLLHGTLREYQHIGLDWLVTMNEKKLNGILADEMGLGKTIQTIALLAHLACVKGNWGPHLIIVPTSVMLNWEMELKRWCPGFKILTYYGSQKERKLKRQGWTKPNAFHVCITSYKLVLQDHQAFRRKSWRYLILDEAQNIKNFKSQRWQSLLNFNSQRRLLLTGTPLQNSLMELWSLMHFLMPHVFQSHREFKEWFSNPLTGMIEGSQEYNEGLVKRLHKVLRPFLLRRIKADVEKQMPKKYEHVVRCRLSKRQRFLYDDFMAQASTRETLASGHFMSVINILMQLRKVCNHPNLFDPRPIQSPFITKAVVYSTASLVQRALETSPFERCDLSLFDLIGLEQRVSRYQADVFLPQRKVTHQLIQEIMESPDPPPRPKPVRMKVNRMLQPVPKSDGRSSANSPRPSTTTVQTPKPLITEVTPSQAPSQPAPLGQTPVAPSNVPSAPAVRPPAPQPVTVRPSGLSSITTVSTPPQPPSNIMTQRVLLSPDMQARLPSGEVVSIAQLASLAGRPVSSSQGSKPVTFQLQGNKLTLSGTPLNQVPVPQPRPIQGNVMHLVSSSGQHHLISQPAQVTVLHTVSQSGSSSANPHPTSTIPTCSGLAVPFTATQGTVSKLSLFLIAVPTPMVSGPGIVKIVVRQAPSKEGGSIPTLAVPPSPRPAPPQSVTLHPHGTSSPVLRAPTVSQPPQRPPVYAAPPRTVASSQTPPTRPVLRVVQGPPPPAPEPTGKLSPDVILRVCDRSSSKAPKLALNLNLELNVKIAAVNNSATLKCVPSFHRFTFVIPPVEAKPITMHTCHPPPSLRHQQGHISSVLSSHLSPLTQTLHRIQCNMRTHFPDLRLIQYDCGKLQTLHLLLRKLKAEGHRVLIFTQMTRMLDILEQFLNYHGHIYLRLDGSTRVEQRQALMERFNADCRIFCFILSTRSGGVGVNLTGADTVVFYDSDWNPTMDAQAQDRCHRIGQTRDVHIYRLISERTVEENILKKANQKRMLGDMAIEGGNFTTTFFKQQTIRELFDMSEGERKEAELSVPQSDDDESVNKQQTTILEQALCRAEDEEDIVAASQAKAEQVAELAEFNENIPLDDGDSRDQEEEELSKAEQEIAALVEQVAMIVIPFLYRQDQASSPLQISPGRGHHPCSPAHHSPDMPVLRNLPVRRRLETESRMAAQLGEQFVGRGRGVDRRSAFSPKKPETNSDKDRAAPSDSMAMKRKRGRPPKTPPQALELREEKTPVTQKTSPEQSPSHSPKRKRGRPRKDSTTTTSSSPSSPSTCAPSSQEPNLSRSNVMPVTLPAVSNTSPISSPLNPTSPSNAAEVSSSKLDSETNQKTTSDLLSSMHRDSQNMSSSTSELGVDSHGETHTNLNPIIAWIDSDTSTFETSPHNTSPATISQTCTASSPTLHPPSPLREPPTCTVSIHEEELAHTPVLFETSEITASSEPSNVSAAAVETKEVSLTVNQQKDNLQSSNTLTQVTSQPLHRTSTTEDSPQTSIEHMCSIDVSLTPTHQSSTQPSPSPSLTSGIKPESSSFKLEAQEPTVTLTVSTVQQSTPKSDQTSVPPSQPQTTDIEAATDSALESHKMSSTSSQSPSTTNQITNSLSTSNYTDADSSQSKNMPVETMADNQEGQHSPKEEVVTEEEVVTRETEKMEIDSVAEDDAGEKDGILSQLKRRKSVRLPKEQTPGASGVASSNSDIESHDDPKIDGPDKPSEEESRKYKETRTSAKKRSISRQSSQESVRSSSPSSVSSCGTRSSQSKKAGENRRPAKRKQEDIKSEKEKNEEESDKKHQSNSSSSSSDSEELNSIKRCLTRSAQKKLEKGGVIAKNEESSKRQQGSSDKKGKTTNTTEGESSGETCSRGARKSAGPQPNTVASPEPEVLGKRCSALNAAAKLLAMRGRGPDTPSPRSKTAAQQSKLLSFEKSSKPKGKTGQDSPKMSNSKAGSGRQTPNQSNESPQSSSSARSTRQRPGSLVPPLETERVKKEEKKKTSDQKEEGEDENRETRSSGGHSACSSISSERGAGSSRSRSSSSSNSSQRTHSLSSRSTEPTRSRSRAASSGSDTERGKSIWHKSDGGRGRESRKEKRSQKQDKLELSAGSSDGTPNRVLRSVAAIAAAQARTPASNTRSSSTQNRHSKT
uniref:Helicase SRCAP-like n=1 Tax=Sinocyclocheilus grahami TaxID=75366 RepID=A0A672QWY8_SINGR